jgi:ATP-dependent helicase/nuclease subunit A
MTFDAFCARLTSLMPHLSKLGGLSKMSNDPHKLYEKAAIAFINDKKSPLWEKHIPEVLLPLNNNIEKFIRLSCDLLAKREQWLPLIANLNSSAKNLINNNIIK